MRLPLLLFLFFEVSYSNPPVQLPEGLIRSGSIHDGRIELDQNVLQQFIKFVVPSAGNIRPYPGDETSTAVVFENAQNQQNYEKSPKYQYVTQYPKKYQGQEEEEEGEGEQRIQSVQQNINSQHIFKRMTDENSFKNQNFNHQPQNVPSRQVLYQLGQRNYQQTSQNVDGVRQENPIMFRRQSEYVSQDHEKTIQQQQMLQQQQQQQQILQQQQQQMLQQQQNQILQQQRQQQMLQEQQEQQKLLLLEKNQQQLQQQQQFQQQQQQQQLQQQVEQQQLLQQQQKLQQQQQQQYQQSKIHQPHAFLPPYPNYQQIKQHYAKHLQQRQETQQVPQVQRLEFSENLKADGRGETEHDQQQPSIPQTFPPAQQSTGLQALPPSVIGVPSYLHQRQQRDDSFTPYQLGLHPTHQRSARHHPNGDELCQPSVYFGQHLCP